MSRRLEAAVMNAEPDGAARVIDFWGGAGCFEALPPQVRDYCRKTASANVLDWHTDFGFAPTAAEYADLAMPVLLVRGELANAAMVAMTDRLAALLPRSRPAVVADAGHFLISSHPAACAALLGAFLAEVVPDPAAQS